MKTFTPRTENTVLALSSMFVSIPISFDRNGELIKLGAVLHSLVYCSSPFITVAKITCRAECASMFAALPPYVRRPTFTTF